MLVKGTTDRNKKLHPFGMVVAMHETFEEFRFQFKSLRDAVVKQTGIEITPDVLIGDDAGAITNGFKEIFTLVKVSYFFDRIGDGDK